MAISAHSGNFYLEDLLPSFCGIDQSERGAKSTWLGILPSMFEVAIESQRWSSSHLYTIYVYLCTISIPFILQFSKALAVHCPLHLAKPRQRPLEVGLPWPLNRTMSPVTQKASTCLAELHLDNFTWYCKIYKDSHANAEAFPLDILGLPLSEGS